jgi:chromosome segregation ATPase
MRLKPLFCILLCTLMAIPLWAGAQDNGDDADLPPGAVFRYEREDGSTAISSSLSDEAIEQGYDVLNQNGRVIRTVEPALTEQERKQLEKQEKRQRRKQKQQKRDEQLLRMYAGPGDARRARDRQIEALKVNISYARNSLQGVKDKLDREVSNAAKYEQRGEKVPSSIQDSINRFQSQIAQHKKEIQQYKDEIEEVRAKYKPMIERLQEIAPEEDQSGASAGGGDKDAAREASSPD